LFQHCASIFFDKYKINITTGEPEYTKSKLKLLEACQKAKHTMTGNKETSIGVECLFEDYDFSCNVGRTIFDKISEQLYNKFEVCLKTLLDRLTKDIKLHSVEIIGGATRMPKLQLIISNL
jgi:molecular chaperone DnaK (HSP70)